MATVRGKIRTVSHRDIARLVQPSTSPSSSLPS